MSATAPLLHFDIDGTLLLLRGVGRRAMEQAMHERWGLENALEGVSFGGATDGGVAARVGPGRDRGPMWARYVELLAVRLAREGDACRPLPGVVGLLDRLEAEGARLGLFTGNLKASARLKLAAVGLDGRFDESISAFAEDGDEREAIALALRERCGGSALTLVGDSTADIRCARRIGARVLCVATGVQPRAELERERPDLLVDDLTATGALAAWLLARS